VGRKKLELGFDYRLGLVGESGESFDGFFLLISKFLASNPVNLGVGNEQ
jgi:hypothetical protein